MNTFLKSNNQDKAAKPLPHLFINEQVPGTNVVQPLCTDCATKWLLQLRLIISLICQIEETSLQTMHIAKVSKPSQCASSSSHSVMSEIDDKVELWPVRVS